jgi:uncharacterized protein (TIGR01777 family)
MKVLVTGSSGFIGSALVRSLEAAGHDVLRLVRRAPHDGEAPWDPSTESLDARDIEGVEVAIHLAGVGIGDRRWTEEHKARVLDSRVRGTRLLSETLARLGHPPEALLSASAVGFYGQRGDEVLTEDSAPGTDFLARVCRAWEVQTEPAREAGIRVVTFRSGLVLDRSGGILSRMLLPFRVGLGGRLGAGRQWWSWITLGDEVAALLHLAQTSAISGPVNLTAPNPVTNAEFTEALGRALGRPTFLPVPAAALRMALGAEMARELMLASQRALPAALERGGFRWAHPRLDAALRSTLGP